MNAKENQDPSDFGTTIRLLFNALNVLEARSGMTGAPSLSGQEWYELLRQKLLPQSGDGAWLVVAVTGGTNIGKSVVFNHLAGYRASAVSPLASGTRHVTCLMPPGFREAHDLQAIFPDFVLCEWSNALQTLEESAEHRVFLRESEQLPESLLILDTPDIDSDARINWFRADAIRRSADVLIAVLTQQKYNDAAVKAFFRKAAEEDKAVLVVFNQVLLPEDEPYWPIWLKTFCDETGVRPERVYVAPADRRAAEENRLPFLERPWNLDQLPTRPETIGSSELRDDLAHLHFSEIRLRTLRGSIRELVHPERGVPVWLRQLRTVSEEFRRSAQRLSTDSVTQVRNWPHPSNAVFAAELRKWWQERQVGWAKAINRVYNVAGRGVMWPVKAVQRAMQGEPIPAMEEYRQREWTAILNVIDELSGKLKWLADSESSLLKPLLEKLISGDSVALFLKRLKSEHEETDFDAELTAVVHSEMETLQKERPDLYSVYRQLNNVSAAFRPVTSVVLFTAGFGPAGELVGPMLGHAAASAVVHVMADVAGGATAAIAGEAAVAGAAVTGAGKLQAWFHRLHQAFATRRAQWLSVRVQRDMLRELPIQLQTAGELPDSVEYRQVENLVRQLSRI